MENIQFSQQFTRSASAAVRDLVCGYSHEVRERRIMAMLQGFIDDSGSEPQSQFFILAGFAHDTTRWEKFSDDWDYQLRRRPGIEYFKMHEAVTREGQFQGWRPEFVLCKVKDLLSVIEQHSPAGVSCLVEWGDFKNVFGADVVNELRSPYVLLFTLVFQAIKNYQKKLGIYPTPIDVDFDDQGKIGHFAQHVYRDIKEQYSGTPMQRMLGRVPILLDEKIVLPLQAADMLAWVERNSLQPGSGEWDWLYDRLNPLVFSRMRYDAEDLKLLMHFKDHPDG